LLLLGIGAGKAPILLHHKYKAQQSFLAAIPSVRAMENRKANIKRRHGGKWEFSTFAEINVWAAANLCQRQVDYQRLVDDNPDGKHATAVLDIFQWNMTGCLRYITPRQPF
jgi:hypothetical protein